MDDFNTETDSDYTSYWRDWVSLPLIPNVLKTSASSFLYSGSIIFHTSTNHLGNHDSDTPLEDWASTAVAQRYFFTRFIMIYYCNLPCLRFAFSISTKGTQKSHGLPEVHVSQCYLLPWHFRIYPRSSAPCAFVLSKILQILCTEFKEVSFYHTNLEYVGFRRHLHKICIIV